MFVQRIGAPLTHVAVLGNALPRRCGLATYTTHSVEALRCAFPGVRIDHYAMDDGHGVQYGDDVAMTIRADDLSQYVRAATTIARSGAQCLFIQHEFGIFGGSAGAHLLTLLRHINMPVVVTLHTVLAEPDADQMRVMRAIVDKADGLIVMADHARALLEKVYDANPSRIAVIPHGAPDRPLVPAAQLKAKLGLRDGPIVLTFGLLSPGKGIETAIEALPPVVAQHPDLRYLVVGATHPALIREQGEHYRETLIEKARALGLSDHVQFIDRFLDDDELLDHLQACDIYLTPYLGREQVTSGTLSYALAMGRPVISTPYIHAREALGNGIGTLVPFRDAGAISAALLEHLEDETALSDRARWVWSSARDTIWKHNARAVMTMLSKAKASLPTVLGERTHQEPEHLVQIEGISAMTDDVGIYQHSIHGIPDRRHGYCTDDNARALKLICETRVGDPAVRRRLALTYAAFLEHAWNDEAGRFRNFMGFDRQWLETEGSEDSNGRALWCLGGVVRSAPTDDLRRWALGMFNRAFPIVEEMHSPRAIAFAMLGATAMLEIEPRHEACRAFLARSCALFTDLLAHARRPNWAWFEIVLAYDNCRLPQAMLEAGRVLEDSASIDIGLSTLRWILDRQKAPDGHFRPVGSDSFGAAYADPKPFDQQPLEATAAIEACAAAFSLQPDAAWTDTARSAYAWFFGANDLGAALASDDGTLCYDGLTPQGVNLNQGAESILALQMARHAMAELLGEAAPEPQLSMAC